MVPRCIALSKHGLIAVGLPNESGLIALYSINTGVYKKPLEVIEFSNYPNYLDVRAENFISKDELKCLKFSAEGDFLITGGDGTFGIIPVYDKDVLPYFYGVKVLVRVIAIDPDERRILACPQMQSFMLFYKAASRRVKRTITSATT